MTKAISHSPKMDADSNTSIKNSSVQSQLLELAHQYVLDGNMLPDDKQMPLADRCQKRMRVIELRKQQNLELIMTKALGYCNEQMAAPKPDQDWFNSYTRFAENISNASMQSLWAKILAGELNRPGSFSLKTLKLFRELSIADAKLFAKACSLAVRDQQKKNLRLLTGCYQLPGLSNFFSGNRRQNINLADFGLSYTDILTLANQQLLFEQETEAHFANKGHNSSLVYNGQPLNLVSNKNKLVLSFYKFTQAGTELAQLIADNPQPEFFVHTQQQLSQHFSI